MKRFRRLPSVLLLIAYAWSNVAGGTWVLCYGSDGHVTVEARGSACCSETDAGLKPGDSGVWEAAPLSLEPSRGCGACKDVPLFTAANDHPGPLLPDADLAAAAVSPSSHDVCRGMAPGFGLPPRPSGSDLRPDDTLERLRVIVLRC